MTQDNTMLAASFALQYQGRAAFFIASKRTFRIAVWFYERSGFIGIFKFLNNDIALLVELQVLLYYLLAVGARRVP